MFNLLVYVWRAAHLNTELISVIDIDSSPAQVRVIHNVNASAPSSSGSRRTVL